MSDRASGAYMSLAEAGRLIGMKGSPEAVALRLRRVLMAKERERRRPIMLRAGGPKKRRYLVTRRQLLELFQPRKDELADVVRAELESVVAELTAEQQWCRDTVEHFARRVVELTKLVRSLQSRRNPTRIDKSA